MKLIGFATQYYTYWNYTSVPIWEVTKDGKSHQIGIRENYIYEQNLSKNLEEAKRKYIEKTRNEKPDWGSIIDESLRGQTTSFQREKKEKLPDEYFSKGKYYGELISECTDISYLEWAYSNILSEKSKEIALSILKENDYVIHEFEDGDKQLMKVESQEKLLKDLEKSKYFESLQKGFLLTDGEKVSLIGKCIEKYSRDGFYGLTFTYLFDIDGMLIRYEGGREYEEIREDSSYELTGTVKHHSYWSDLHQLEVQYTKLLRMKVKQIQTV